MSWAVIVSGLGGVALFALGFNLVLPLDDTLDSVCMLTGAVSVLVFFGLVDGA